jgi:hypothetical protein
MNDYAFDSAPQSKKNLLVYLVNPPTGDNPWRTKQDYLDDQKRMLWAFRMTIAASLAAIVSALTAITLVALELKKRSEVKQSYSQEQTY